MLRWAFEANFTNCNRRITQESFFHVMHVEKGQIEMKSVTHVYAHCVTHVLAPCREGKVRVMDFVMFVCPHPPAFSVDNNRATDAVRVAATHAKWFHDSIPYPGAAANSKTAKL